MIKNILRFKDSDFTILLEEKADHNFSAKINDEPFEAKLQKIADNTFSIFHDGHHYNAYVAVEDTKVYVLVNGQQYVFDKPKEKKSGYRPGMEESADNGNEVRAPMPGKILKIFVKEGQKFNKNDRLFIVEAMKMENEVKASRAGTIKKINFKENDMVSVGEAVIEIES